MRYRITTTETIDVRMPVFSRSEGGASRDEMHISIIGTTAAYLVADSALGC
jgi:hypothetical protein